MFSQCDSGICRLDLKVPTSLFTSCTVGACTSAVAAGWWSSSTDGRPRGGVAGPSSTGSTDLNFIEIPTAETCKNCCELSRAAQKQAMSPVTTQLSSAPVPLRGGLLSFSLCSVEFFSHQIQLWLRKLQARLRSVFIQTAVVAASLPGRGSLHSSVLPFPGRLRPSV